MSHQSGASNPNWKGGRTVASNGYVLVKDRDNPMADVRGYVYEHRLVKAREIGRPLLAREQVHHDDEVKTNNDPSNLMLCASVADHRFRHRKDSSNRRAPGQDNPTISCACGCGVAFARFDSSGRPRKFVSGHNKQSAKVSVLCGCGCGEHTKPGSAYRAGHHRRVLHVSVV